jgi:two-component system sensor histidine kinase HydH
MAVATETETLTSGPRMGLMAATLAHEIRNPLASISTNGETLRAVLGEDAGGLRYVDAILGEVDRIETLVSSVLRFAGREKLFRRPVSLAGLAHRVLERSRDRADRQGVRLALTGPDVRVDGDDDLLERLVDNLVRNALEAMPGGGELDVTIAPRATGGARIEVADTGAGLPPDDPECVFEPFYTTRIHGMGLGLPLSRRIAARHGGTLEARSRHPRGSRFVLELPGGTREP